MLPVSMTVLLIGIITVVTFLAFSNRKVYDALIFNPYRIEHNNEYYRFITSGFIHASVLHWFFNVFTFFFAASNIENPYAGLGPYHLLAILLLGMVICDFPSFVKHRNNPGYRSLGASGGVSAVMFAFIMLEPIRTIYILHFPIPAFVFGGLFLLYSYYQGRSESRDNVNHSAHFYGAVVGIVYVLIISPTSLFTFFEQLISWRLPAF